MRVLGGGATYYTWTPDGEIATKHDATGWTHYTWDVDESLTRIQARDVTPENLYNYRMQRVSRAEDGGAATSLVYDTEKLIAEAAGGSLSRAFVSEGPSIYSPLVAQSGSEHSFLFDALGTTIGITDEAGNLTDTFLYEAFGTSLGRTGTTATPYQYGGRYGYYREADLGSALVWWRWLRHSCGGWMSRDPLLGWVPASVVMLPTDYAYQRPTATVDPTGLVPLCDPKDLCAIATWEATRDLCLVTANNLASIALPVWTICAIACVGLLPEPPLFAGCEAACLVLAALAKFIAWVLFRRCTRQADSMAGCRPPEYKDLWPHPQGTRPYKPIELDI